MVLNIQKKTFQRFFNGFFFIRKFPGVEAEPVKTELTVFIT